ncbi:vacuolar sorting protein [Anaeramoeba ignava]|uniref:Vacuolar protein sorting-associated protein 35 n=1 Tax=Anaeramoeba ignava TaxID=1746090 RepID=A0A9Q0LRN8_ANAIG|nr:vacuolar sorting protein [Anaeramoeba ignava]
MSNPLAKRAKSVKSKLQSILTPDQEQAQILKEITTKVQRIAFFMRKDLDEQKTWIALDKASSMIEELSTTALSPKNYYNLYMLIFDELRYLELYLHDEIKKGTKAIEIYKRVQFTGKVLPRLYLLVTCGSVLIKSKEVPVKDVLQDLVDMCRGIQHPTKGLFLRYYLIQMTKDKLPDLNSEYSNSRDGSVKDSIDFILFNFVESNKLWVRIQYQTPPANLSEEKKKQAKMMYQKERAEIRTLIGINLVRLSQLEGVDISLYHGVVLPKIIEQIIECHDTLAQQYLLEVISQVFSDEFHLKTLTLLLEPIAKLQSEVNIKNIYNDLIDRLIRYSQENPKMIPNDVDIFNVFFNSFQSVADTCSTITRYELLTILHYILKLSLSLYLAKLDNTEKILNSAKELIEASDKNDPKEIQEFYDILKTALEKYNNANVILELGSFTSSINLLPYEQRRKIAHDFVDNVVKNATIISELDKVKKFLETIQVLLQDSEDAPPYRKDDDYEQAIFESEQESVCRAAHLLTSPNNINETFQILQLLASSFGTGGERRVQFTVYPLIFVALKLSFLIHSHQKKKIEVPFTAKKVFQFVHKILSSLKAILPEITLRLFLQAAQASSKCGFEAITYEFMTQAILAYEEFIVVTNQQYYIISLIISTLQTIRSFGEDNFSSLSNQCGGYSSKLMLNTHQSRAVYKCGYLFWADDVIIEEKVKETKKPKEKKPKKEKKEKKESDSSDSSESESESESESDEEVEKTVTIKPYFHDSKRLFGCVSRAIRVAGSSMEPAAMFELLFEILNVCLYFFDKGAPEINADYINRLLQLILQNKKENDFKFSQLVSHDVLLFFKSTIQHIDYCKKSGPNQKQYSEIDYSQLAANLD